MVMATARGRQRPVVQARDGLARGSTRSRVAQVRQPALERRAVMNSPGRNSCSSRSEKPW
jgi:hypothetical protein